MFIFFLAAWTFLMGQIAEASPYEQFRLRPDPSLPFPRIIAIGDLHGDYHAMRKTLELAGAINPEGEWIGSHLIVVQTGDLIDRGPDDLQVLDFIARMETAAQQKGSWIIPLNGNHEYLNLQHIFDYASAPSVAAFERVISPVFFAYDLDQFCKQACNPYPWRTPPGKNPFDSSWSDSPDEIRDSFVAKLKEQYEKDLVRPGLAFRAVAFSPNMRRYEALIKRPFFKIIGDTVFVHGGILPEHLTYGLDRIHHEIRDWLMGSSTVRWLFGNERHTPPKVGIASPHSPIWSRRYGLLSADPIAPELLTAEEQETCKALETVLADLQVKRMVIGHTIDPSHNITSACQGKVWRIDIGLSSSMESPSKDYQILSIQGDEIQTLTAPRSSE
jgi:hypothetical protein